MTLLIAIYGAILGTGNLLFNIAQARRGLKVELILSLRSDEDGKYRSGVQVAIRNFSRVPIRATSGGLLWPIKHVGLREKLAKMFKYRRHWRKLTWVHGYFSAETPTGLPITIEPANSHDFWISDEDLVAKVGNDARLCAAFAQDALGRSFYSRPLPILARRHP